MHALSGSTWKGAKLRIGEAKADFTERSVIAPVQSSIVAPAQYYANTPLPSGNAHWKMSQIVLHPQNEPRLQKKKSLRKS